MNEPEPTNLSCPSTKIAFWIEGGGCHLGFWDDEDGTANAGDIDVLTARYIISMPPVQVMYMAERLIEMSLRCLASDLTSFSRSVAAPTPYAPDARLLRWPGFRNQPDRTDVDMSWWRKQMGDQDL